MPRQAPVLQTTKKQNNRRSVSLMQAVVATALVLNIAPAPADEPGDRSDGNYRVWSNEIRDYALKSLKDENALSLAAVPLNGPGIEQFINADTLMSPGSIMKLVTTYAALEILGPTHHWNTSFYMDGEVRGDTLDGNLYVKLGGDPKLTQERLWGLLGELRGMGISAVTGDLVLDGSYFRLSGGSRSSRITATTPIAPSWWSPPPI